jgi:hypothetical protein
VQSADNDQGFEAKDCVNIKLSLLGEKKTPPHSKYAVLVYSK